MATGVNERTSLWSSGVVSDVERHLWVLVVVASLLDVGTTVIGLELGLSEANPVASALMAGMGPIAVMVALKLFVLAFGFVVWRRLPTRYRWAVPLGVALPWLLAGVHNTALIVSIL